MALKLYTSLCGREVETKSQNVFGAMVGAFLPPILNRVKVKRVQEARDNQFLFQNVQNNEIFGIFKMFKNNCWINIYKTKSKRFSLLDWLFCILLEIPFFG